MHRSDLEAIIKLGNESYKNGMEAMDEKWRAAVERVRMGAAPTDWGYEGIVRHDRKAHTHNAALDALLAAMEVDRDGQ